MSKTEYKRLGDYIREVNARNPLLEEEEGTMMPAEDSVI